MTFHIGATLFYALCFFVMFKCVSNFVFRYVIQRIESYKRAAMTAGQVTESGQFIKI